MIRNFYGRPASYSYFNGCSDGGREALIEAQRYPEDFDGILSGAPALNLQVQNGLYHAWNARSNTGSDGKPVLLTAKLPALHRAAVAACDTLDGVSDGLIAAPLACWFDPAVLQCAAGATADANCLTAQEVDIVRKLYDGLRDAASGEKLAISGPLPGSELAWAGIFVPASVEAPMFSRSIAEQFLRDLAFEQSLPANFTVADLRFDRATFDRLRPRHARFDATNPDLRHFAARGAVLRTVGAERAASFERLYFLPGVHHCDGGESPSRIDLLTPLMQWVEQGKVPDAVVTKPVTAQASSFGARDAASAGQQQGPRGVRTSPSSRRPSRARLCLPAAAAL